jgi:hypothetical protein
MCFAISEQAQVTFRGFSAIQIILYQGKYSKTGAAKLFVT